MDGNGGDDGVKARSTHRKANPWIESNKTSSQKNLGLFLGGIFEIEKEHNKIKLENEEGRLRNRYQRGS